MRIFNQDYEGQTLGTITFAKNWNNMMSSNNAELLNLQFKKDRKLPTITIIEQPCSKMQVLFYNWRAHSHMYISTMTMEEELFKTLDVEKKAYVEPLYHFWLDMGSWPNLGYVVNLNDNTYMYRNFQLDSFSCTHVCFSIFSFLTSTSIEDLPTMKVITLHLLTSALYIAYF